MKKVFIIIVTFIFTPVCFAYSADMLKSGLQKMPSGSHNSQPLLTNYAGPDMKQQIAF